MEKIKKMLKFKKDDVAFQNRILVYKTLKNWYDKFVKQALMEWFLLTLTAVVFIGFIAFASIAVQKKQTPLSRKKEEQRREQFISIISHQLRTPLSIVRGYLEALEDEDMGKLTDGQKEYLGEARQINVDMIDLVNRYLEVIAQDSKQLSVNLKAISANNFLQDLAKNFSSYAQATNIEFALDLPKETINITTDTQLLKNALNNIIQNSIKYTIGSGTITLHLSANAEEVTITVEDSGIGIPKDQHDQVFTKFFRGTNIMHRSIAGSGLGLYVAREYINAIQGRITFTSEEGKGTSVSVVLPHA